jgi:hypothetical protein
MIVNVWLMMVNEPRKGLKRLGGVIWCSVSSSPRYMVIFDGKLSS